MRMPRTAAVNLVLLSILPGLAMTTSDVVDWRLAVGICAGMSLLTFGIYGADKKAAVANRPRVPEAALHLFELLGGWPGAYVAQHWFRHKTVKLSFRVVFWIIVLLHEFIALDSLLGWKLLQNAAGWIR
jgi:uncharacterized membrane protein YsdA (DUF1294 family)